MVHDARRRGGRDRRTGCEPMGTAGQRKRGKELIVKAHEIKKNKKYKVELTLSTPRTCRGGAEAQRHLFFASALDAGQWPASRPDRFTLG